MEGGGYNFFVPQGVNSSNDWDKSIDKGEDEAQEMPSKWTSSMGKN